MKRIFISLALMATTAGAVAAGATGAFFSDTETSSGNTFTAGAIDLKIDNTSYYNGVLNLATTWALDELNNGAQTLHKFFDFNDLKPGDIGEDTISLHVNTNDAYLCANVTLTSNDDNGINEPEAGDGDTTDGAGAGELAQEVNFLWWADDGDNVLETSESVISQGPIGNIGPVGSSAYVALADSTTNIWTGVPGPLAGETTQYIGKGWCFGDITLSPVAQDTFGPVGTPGQPGSNGPDFRTAGFSCDGSLLDNSTQTDSLTADVSFQAVQSRNNPGFMCIEPEEPTFGACTPGQQYADAAGLFAQGRTKTGALIVANRSVPGAAFGAPQTAGNPSDVGFPAGSFVSLGFGVSTTSSRSLVLDFSDNVVVDGSGADLRIYEVTGGVYPDEHIKVEASQDGTTWTQVAADVVRDANIDLTGSGLAWAKFVRITDINDPNLFSDSVADGYDLDAVEALNCGVPNLQ